MLVGINFLKFIGQARMDCRRAGPARHGLFIVFLLPVMALPMGSALAQTAPDGLSPLRECRLIADRSARVDCYDAVADRLEAAQTAGELVVVDRGKVSELQRELFGFAAPAMSALFRGGKSDDVGAIESTLQRAVQETDGKWRFHLDDGSQWSQVDFDPVRFQNRQGQPVRVRRAALGSYMLTTGNSRAVRVQRR